MNSRVRFWLLAVTLISSALGFSFGQDIQTAPALFNQVAEKYGQISDYSANVVITVDSARMSGHLFWKKRSRLRIDFTSPAEQVIISDGELLQVYVPKYNVTLTQKLDSGANTINLANGEGLTLLKLNYNIAFKSGPKPVPLDSGSGEMVTKLRLNWKNSNQGFRQIELSITKNKYIRRIEGITADRRTVRIDFYGFSANQGIPDIAFEYNTPPESNRFDNFLFGKTN